MHFGTRSVLASGKICTVLLLGAVMIAMVVPGSDVAFSQGVTGTVAQAPLFTAIDLTPRGFTNSHAWGASGGQQVGDAYDQATGRIHALLWRGSAVSVVDLNPSGFVESEALGSSGRQQTGSGLPPGTPAGVRHALLWSGTAASVVDLHPHGFADSQALGISGGQQVGYGSGTATGGDEHALLWRGTAGSVVDLHPRAFASSQALGISGGQQVGWGSADFGEGMPVWGQHALLWRGSASSVVDLDPHGPRGYGFSQTTATNGEEQAGVGDGHAVLQRGSADSVVDLHALLPPGFVNSYATGIDTNGDIVGFAVGPESYSSHAFLWRRNVPKSGAFREQSTMQC